MGLDTMHISRLNKVVLDVLPGCFDFALVAILNVSGRSNGAC